MPIAPLAPATKLAPLLPFSAVHLRPALLNGAAGVVVTVRGRPITVIGFTVADGRIAEIDAVADPERVRESAAAALDNG